MLRFRLQGLREADFLMTLHSLKQQMAAQYGPYHKREACRRYVAWVEGAGAHVRGTPRSPTSSRHDKRLAALRAGAHADALTSCGSKCDSGQGRGGNDIGVGPGADVWPLHLLDCGDEEQMLVLFQLLRKQPQVVRHYLFERVFPRTMEFQQMKLSACGQELGGDLLFGQRIGFSGTPSSLLPVELGRCAWAPGDDAKMLHILTSPGIVGYASQGEHVLDAAWSAQSLLERVATWRPPLHAFIDTGALITGMTNLEVARELLDLGLSHVRGCVFIDDIGQKRILMRDGLRVMSLEQSGLPIHERFTFYDQVHTMGMDVSQPPAAIAALTLSKDMTFRDYAQGAFRMRDIGAGQRIELLVIPEVQRLICDAVHAAAGAQERDWLPHAGSHGQAVEDGTDQNTAILNDVAADDSVLRYADSSARGLLRHVVLWLHLNSMRSEKMQFRLLCEQTLANVWRKAAYRALEMMPQERLELLGMRQTDGPPKLHGRRELQQREGLQNCIDVFREKVALEVTEYAPSRSTNVQDGLLEGGMERLLTKKPEADFIIDKEQVRIAPPVQP